MFGNKRVLSSVLIVLLLLGAVFYYGFSYGKGLGEIALEDYVNRGKKLALENSVKFRDLETTHRERENKLLKSLMEQKESYENSISNLSNDYNARMLKQKDRADYFRRLSESKHSERPNLTEHTIQLDTSLEEGIKLVNELSETIRLLERNIEARDKIIANDRKIINERK